MRKNDEILQSKFEGACSKLTYLGLGETKYKDEVIYVPDFYPGEEGEVLVSYKRNGQYFGKLLSLSKPSKDRIPSECPYFKQCGGCIFQDYSYEKEKEHKRLLVQNQLHKITGIDVDVNPTIGMEEPSHYRNKIQLHFGRDKNGSTVLGFYKEGTHVVFPVKKCLIEDKRASDISSQILALVRDLEIPPYQEENGTGELKHLLIRTSFHKEQILCVLVTKDLKFANRDKLMTMIQRCCPQITTLVQSINGKKTNVILGNKEVVLYGPGYIEDELCGLSFKISARSFYQVNPEMTETLYEKAMEFADLKETDVVLDAYSGIGTIGLIAAKNAQKSIGVELVPEAVKDSIENAKRNEIRNFEAHEDDATSFIQKYAKLGMKVDVLFMDPPRKGSTPEFLAATKELKPRKVIYIACAPSSLARDLKELLEDYSLDAIQPIDMFPRTAHVECITLLCRKDVKNS
ncbi:MAG TPA: 23S rRNA (uracil(1939)-C(5))-methyltransferase RlmD [Firmicutes bacterium]|nr:23S rRNA (uracil(1939)-C(5))-methyltransferase RlmD [Bacillota bacterium]